MCVMIQRAPTRSLWRTARHVRYRSATCAFCSAHRAIRWLSSDRSRESLPCWMAAGLVGGALGILVVVRLLRDLLYAVQPFDPIAIGSAVAILIGCAALA